MTKITFKKTDLASHSHDLLSGGSIAAKYAAFIDGELTYIIIQTQRASWSSVARWRVFSADGGMTKIRYGRTLKATKENITQYIYENGVDNTETSRVNLTHRN